MGWWDYGTAFPGYGVRDVTRSSVALTTRCRFSSGIGSRLFSIDEEVFTVLEGEGRCD